MTTRITRPLTRRHLLRAGSFSIALPLLGAMLPRRARAAGSGTGKDGRPKRFVGVLVPNGTLPELYFPLVGGTTDFQLNTLMKSLAPHRQDLVILKGVDNIAQSRGPKDGHREGVPSFLNGFPLVGGSKTTTATGGGTSIDQMIAQTHGKTTRLGSIAIGVEGGGGVLTSLSWVDRGRYLPNEGNPRNLFVRMFGEGTKSTAEFNQLQADKRSVLDGLLGDFKSLTGQLDGTDRARLEEHAQAIREVELRFATTIACDVPPAPAATSVSYDKWPSVMFDLVALAFACDITRVATLVYRHPGGGGSYFPFLGLGSSYWRCAPQMPVCDPMSAMAMRQSDEHHEMSHSPKVYQNQLGLILDWHYGRLGYLIDRLKATKDGAVSVFDNSVVVQGSDIATGPHTHADMPYLIAGSAGGSIATGRFLTFQKTPHNRMLLSLLHAFGIDVPTVGPADLCPGPLPGLLA